MSHFTKVKSQIKNLEAFENAVREIGLTRQESGVVPGWRGQTKKFEYAYADSSKGIGLVQNKGEDSYSMEADWYLFAGNAQQKVMQGYAKNVAEDYVAQIQAKGFTDNGWETEGQNLVLEAVRY